MRQATLCFLVKEQNGKISEILFAKKQLRLGVGKWNGAGGRVEEGEPIELGVVREVREELGCEIHRPWKVGRSPSFTGRSNERTNSASTTDVTLR